MRRNPNQADTSLPFRSFIIILVTRSYCQDSEVIVVESGKRGIDYVMTTF
jgi:hypothetical protein